MAEPLNICVVDDDRDVTEGLAEILELAGHRVRTAFTGQDALRILGEANCDMAFINAMLPELNTLESFLAICRSRPGLKAVMMTGYTIEQLLRQTVRNGSVSVLQRPLAMDEVLRALAGAGPKGIVLIAEDDPEIAAKISDAVSLQDHRVGIARSPGDALDVVLAGDCDILVLDLRLPVVGALEVYLDLEKQDRSLPTIIITDCPDNESGPIDLLRDPAVTGVLVKPFDPARLLASLETVHKTAEEPPVEQKQVDASQHLAGQCGRILVIDDDRDLAEGLGDILRDLGHSIEIAFTGDEALEIAARFDAQIALVDIKLGRTSGLELIASLKKLRPALVNVVITANAGKDSVIASLRSGAFDFLNKPMHPQDLFLIIDRCFEHIRAQEAKAATSGESSPDLVANVSHELRDPLNAVIGFSEILGDQMLGPLGSEQYVHYARGINQAGHHLTTVIDDMIERVPPGDEPQDDSAQGPDPHTASNDEETPEHALGQPLPGAPHQIGAEPSGPQLVDRQAEARVCEPQAAFGQSLGEPSSGQLRDPEPKAETPQSGRPMRAGLEPQETWPNQPNPDLPAGEHAAAHLDGTEEAQLEATRASRDEAGPNAAAWPRFDPVDGDPPPPLFSAAVWDDDQPIPSDPAQPEHERAKVTSDVGEAPWPSETEPGMAKTRPVQNEEPEPAWPEPGQAHPAAAVPRESPPLESGPPTPAWEDSHAAQDPPNEPDTSELAWLDSLADDFMLGLPPAGEPPSEHGPSADPQEGQDEQDDEEQALDGQDPIQRDQMSGDRDQKSEAEKIVQLSPFRKVI
jgi:DNA-binding NtrC family response regulator